MSDSLILGNLNLGSPKKKKPSPDFSPRKRKIQENDDRKNDELIVTKKFPSSEQVSNDIKSSFEFTTNHRTSRLFDDNFRNIPELKLVSKDVKHEQMFSDVNFCDLNLNPMLAACLEQRFNLTISTKVQALSIPLLLEGHDALIKSVTGSGKTLAYSIPLVHSLQLIEPKITRSDGLHAMIILPTRELAIQTYDCIDRLLNPFRRIVIGLMIGGEKKKSEKARIRKGINIMVTTPGRLLDHINRTRNLDLSKLKWLIIDEADRLYEQGFSAIIGQIIECIKNACVDRIQTVLLSATLSEGVKELAGLSLKNPKLIDVGNDQPLNLENITLPRSLKNDYMIVPAKLRLVVLSCIILDSLIKHPQTSKMIIFTSCQDVVDFYSSLLAKVLSHFLSDNSSVKIFKLHGNMKQASRTEVFKEFHSATHGILFCTDVASRGLDLPNVDLVIQMSSPSMVEDFVHRVGRTARLDKKGQSILVLLPSEIKFIEYLQEQISINFNAIKMDNYFKSAKCLQFTNDNLNTEQERLAHLQHIYEKFVADNDGLHQIASKAYLSYLRSYATYPRQLSPYLPFRMLHLGHIAKSFALLEPPKQLVSKYHKQFKKTVDINSLKRNNVPLEERISEFGGFDPEPVTVKKRKKIHR